MSEPDADHEQQQRAADMQLAADLVASVATAIEGAVAPFERLGSEVKFLQFVILTALMTVIGNRMKAAIEVEPSRGLSWAIATIRQLEVHCGIVSRHVH